MHSIVTEQGLVSRSSEFETAIQNGEKTSLRIFCEKKFQESEYVFFLILVIFSSISCIPHPVYTSLLALSEQIFR